MHQQVSASATTSDTTHRPTKAPLTMKRIFVVSIMTVSDLAASSQGGRRDNLNLLSSKAIWNEGVWTHLSRSFQAHP